MFFLFHPGGWLVDSQSLPRFTPGWVASLISPRADRLVSLVWNMRKTDRKSLSRWDSTCWHLPVDCSGMLSWVWFYHWHLSQPKVSCHSFLTLSSPWLWLCSAMSSQEEFYPEVWEGLWQLQISSQEICWLCTSWKIVHNPVRTYQTNLDNLFLIVYQFWVNYHPVIKHGWPENSLFLNGGLIRKIIDQRSICHQTVFDYRRTRSTKPPISIASLSSRESSYRHHQLHRTAVLRPPETGSRKGGTISSMASWNIPPGNQF